MNPRQWIFTKIFAFTTMEEKFSVNLIIRFSKSITKTTLLLCELWFFQDFMKKIYPINNIYILHLMLTANENCTLLRRHQHSASWSLQNHWNERWKIITLGQLLNLMFCAATLERHDHCFVRFGRICSTLSRVTLRTFWSYCLLHCFTVIHN
jgi:hypothetical protein